jgi:hypothetical protein
MSLVQEAERSIARMTPGEFEAFLVWLRDRVSIQLGASVPVVKPSAQEQSMAQDDRLKSGTEEPFRYVDLEALPEAARRKARTIVDEWRTRHGC